MKKQLLCLLLAGSVVFATGCNTGGSTIEPQEVKAGTPDYTSAVGEIELDCWLAPSLSDEQYKLYADCGYNYAHFMNTSFGHTSSRETVEGHFELAKKYGIKVMLGMNAFNVNQNSAVPFETYDKKFGDIFDKYAADGTLAGYMPCDEPSFMFGLVEPNGATLGQRQYDDIGDYLLDEYIYFTNRFPGKKFETVLLHGPDIGSTSLMIGEGKRFATDVDYFNHYYNNVLQYVPYGQRIFSMDAYPFKTGRDELYIRDCTITALETMGYLAEEYGAEKWTYLMNHENVYNVQSVLYQYYTFLAYGYTHFVTYCYTHQYGDISSIDANGRPTDNYYYYQEAHEELKTFENVYMQFTDNWLGCMAFVGTESITNDTRRPWKGARKLLDGYHRVKSVTSTQDLLIGVMKDKDGYEGFMLSNQMNPTGTTANIRNKVEVTFDQAEKAIVYQNGQEPVTYELENGKLALTLKSGGGAFVIPVKGA